MAQFQLPAQNSFFEVPAMAQGRFLRIQRLQQRSFLIPLLGLQLCDVLAMPLAHGVQLALHARNRFLESELLPVSEDLDPRFVEGVHGFVVVVLLL